MLVSDLLPASGRVPAGSASTGTGSSRAASFFDADSVGANARVVGDIGFATRGLSVAQHAQRVLAHLRDEYGTTR
ncbi:MAG TPA: hypothetical protein VMG60_09155 [Burkholderiaceae bacterium]|nr:hypothetical protein [Burkholderiaceae bacterium]